jgi:hypothetical protein
MVLVVFQIDHYQHLFICARVWHGLGIFHISVFKNFDD